MQIRVWVLVSVLTACGSTGGERTRPTELPRPIDTDIPPLRLPGLDKHLIDASSDPCIDFFQYACGNFPTLYPVMSSSSSLDIDSMLDGYTDHVVHEILVRAAQPRADRTPSEQKLGDAYASCMDTATIDRLGLQPLQPELARIEALATKAELPELLAHAQLIDVNAFFGLGPRQDLKDVKKYNAALWPGALGLPHADDYVRTGAEDEKIRAQYVLHVATTLILLGTPARQAARDAKAILALETALAKAFLSVPSESDLESFYHVISVAELASLAPSFAWQRFFAASGAPPITELEVRSLDSVRSFEEVIASTDLEAIKAYLRWQLVFWTPSDALPAPLDTEYFKFYGRQLHGRSQPAERWRRCVRAMEGRSRLRDAIGQAYAPRALAPAARRAAQQVVEDIEAALDSDIDTLDWMSAATKARAMQKVHAILDHVGYPERWRDDTELKIVRGDAYGNAVRAIELEARRNLAKIGRPVDRGEWYLGATLADAAYDVRMNAITVPAGLLQPPIYDSRSTDAENYGHLGSTIGHVLLYGFDRDGRRFNDRGDFEDWWTPEDIQRFDDKKACMVAEYGRFVALGDLRVDGAQTLDENIADNGGLRLAYAAFLADAKRKAIDLTRAQDGYTPIQQFFLGYGQRRCVTASIERKFQTGRRAPDKFRVNGVVQNMPEFGQAFGCKVGQPMMPATTCRVW